MLPILLPNGLPSTCSGCSLSTNPKPGYFTKITGAGRSGVLIVGEASGEWEGKEGRPFVEWAPAGSILEKAIRTAGYTRDDFFITNLILCRPPNNYLAGAPYEREAIDHCSQYINRAIAELKPRAILALGSIPLRELTGLVGERSSISYLRGFVLQGPSGIPVIPTFHPSYITRKHTSLIGVLIRDINTARAAAAGRVEYVVNPKEEIELREGVKAFEDLLKEIEEDVEVCVSFDIETPRSQKGEKDELIESGPDTDNDEGGYGEDIDEMEYGESGADSSDERGIPSDNSLDSSHSNILSIQFAISDKWGIYGDWKDPKIRELAQRILGTKNPKVGHYINYFDLVILEKNGVIVNGEKYDTHSMIKALQPDLPAKLQQVAVNYGWCLAARQKVPLWNGDIKTIKEIVDNRLKVTLKGMDKQGKIIPVNVVDWHKQEVPGQKWIRIRVDGAGRNPIYATPDHLIYTKNFAVRADNIKVGMEIPLPVPGADDLIQGMLLGDAHVKETNQLSLVHGLAQRPYAEIKARALGMGNLRERKNNKTTSVVAQCLVDSKWRNIFYPDGKRVFIPPISFKALAIWYMDDGHWKKYNNRASGDGTASIALHKTYDTDDILAYFESVFGANLTLSKGGGDYYQLYIKTATRDKFYEAIAPYVYPSMDYKLPPGYRNRYNGWIEDLTNISRTGTVKTVETDFRSQGVLGENNVRYCVTVDHPTHRFFTTGGLVSNCFPWKHYSGIDDMFYGIADVCSVVLIMSKLAPEMEKLGMWDGYQRYIREQREKSEIPWERRGIPINVERLDEMREWLGVEIDTKVSEIISIVPPELHQMDPKEGFKNLPGEIKDFVLQQHPDLMAPVPWLKKDGSQRVDKEGNLVTKKNNTKIKDIYEMLLKGELNGTLSNVLSNFPDFRVTRDGTRMFRFVPFNPRSSKQMIEYLKFKGYEVPKTFREGKETTGDKMMRRLQEKTKDPVIALSREIRALNKMMDSYTGKRGEDGIVRGGWIPDGDGRLRTRAMTNSTWQYSSKAPNVFTLPKRRKELADRFRRCVVAEPGHVLIEADFRAFHDLTTASLATDDRKWRTAKLDPHAYVAGWLVKFPGIERALDMNDSDLKEYLKEIKRLHTKVRNEQAKAMNHAANFGASYKRLYFENEEYFESEQQAKILLDKLKTIYPKTFRWQEELLKSLDIGNGRVPYLQSAWGARRWLWDCWTWRRTEDGRWYKTRGQDCEKALAFLPSNHAHGLFRKKMVEAAELGWLDRYEIVMFPHDAWVLHPPRELADECIDNIKRHLESPVMELANPVLCPDGFSCGIDIAIGPSMAEMEEVKF